MMGSLWEYAKAESLACSCIVVSSVRFVAVKWRLTGRAELLLWVEAVRKR